MEITYLHQYFNTPTMQGSTRSYEMAKRLVDRGHVVRIVTSWREKTPERGWFVTNEGGIEVHWIPVPYGNEMSYGARLRAFFRFATRAAWKAASLRGDVVLATSTPLTICLPGIYASRRRRIPMVFEVRDLWPEMPIAIGAIKNPGTIWLARKLERLAYQNSKRIVALSPGMADGIVAAGFPRERIEVIPNSCDLELFQPADDKVDLFLTKHGELRGGPIILYAGTIGRVNGVEYLVKLAVISFASNPMAKFVIIGSGSKLAEVKRLAEEHGVLNRNLYIYPQLPKKDVVLAFAAATIVTSLFADIREMEKNSANKFFDGLAAGKPVAINYGGWQAELLQTNGAGIVLSRDPSTAANQLAAFLEDSRNMEEAGKAALRLAKERFSRDLLAQQLETVLKNAVSDDRINRA